MSHFCVTEQNLARYQTTSTTCLSALRTCRGLLGPVKLADCKSRFQELERWWAPKCLCQNKKNNKNWLGPLAYDQKQEPTVSFLLVSHWCVVLVEKNCRVTFLYSYICLKMSLSPCVDDFSPKPWPPTVAWYCHMHQKHSSVLYPAL